MSTRQHISPALAGDVSQLLSDLALDHLPVKPQRVNNCMEQILVRIKTLSSWEQCPLKDGTLIKLIKLLLALAASNTATSSVTLAQLGVPTSEINLFFTGESKAEDQAALERDIGASLTTLRANLTRLAASTKINKKSKGKAKVDSSSAAAKAGDRSIEAFAAGSSDESAASDEEADQPARKVRRITPPAGQDSTPAMMEQLMGAMKPPTLQEQQALIVANGQANQALAQTIMAGLSNFFGHLVNGGQQLQLQPQGFGIPFNPPVFRPQGPPPAPRVACTTCGSSFDRVRVLTSECPVCGSGLSLPL